MNVAAGGAARSKFRGEQREHGVVDDVTRHRRQRAARELGDPAEVETQQEGEDRVEPLDVQDAEAGTGDQDRESRSKALTEPRLHVGPEGDFLRRAGQDPDHDHREEQVGTDRLRECLTDRDHAASLAKPREHRERVERLAERQHPDNHDHERAAGLPARDQAQRDERRAAIDGQRRQQERRGRGDGAGQQSREALEHGVLGKIRIQAVNDAGGEEREGDDRRERSHVREEHRPQRRSVSQSPALECRRYQVLRRRLLVRVPEAKHGRLVERAAHDLEGERSAVGRPAAR